MSITSEERSALEETAGSLQPPVVERRPAPRSTKRRPTKALFLVTVVSVAGLGLLAGRVITAFSWSSDSVRTFLVLACLTALVEQFPIRIRHGAETETFTIADVVWTAGLVLAPADVVIASAAAGWLLGHALQKTSLSKVGFNVGQFVLALEAAEAVFHAVGPTTPLDPKTWVAAVLGMTVYFAVNEGLVALIISFAHREPLRQVLWGPMSLNVLHWAGNVAIGVTAAVMWSVEPVGTIFLLLPIGLSYLAYVGWLNSNQERDRVRRLYEAGQILLSRLEEGGDFRPFLDVVARLVDADDVSLVVETSTGAIVYGLASDDVVTRPDDGRVVTQWAPDVLPVHDEGKHEVALVGTSRDPRGALVVFRPDPLPSAVRPLLESLAAQVYVKLRHIEVFSESLQRGRELGDIIASSSDGIILVAGDGTVASWNPAMQAVTGYSSAEAVGRPLSEVGFTTDLLGASAAGGAGSTFLYTRKDESTRWLRLAASPMIGAESGTVVVVADVTAELETERAKSDFIAAVSHELRTPLTPLKGYLTLFAGGQIGPSDAGAAEYFKSMLKQANRLEDLIGDLLDVSSFDGDRMNVRITDVDVIPLIEQAVADTLVGHPSRSVRFAPSKDPMLVRADPRRVQQVVGNLLSNAMKYSPPDTPVDITFARESGTCVVAVRDRGMGIPESEQERIFEMFHRVDNGTTRTEGGTGLGLHIARRLVETMSGRMWIDSTPGQGSTFWFSLPLSADSTPAAPD